MSSISFGGGCSAAAFTSLQSSRASEASRTEQLFGKLDTSGDGEIDATELGAFVDAIAAKTGGAAVDAGGLMTSLDSDGNGSISNTELGDNLQSLFDQLRGQVMGSQLQSRPPPPDPAEMFGKIDTDGDGSISKAELETFTADRADSAGNAPSVADILARDDADGDGAISSDEFMTAMQKGPGGPPPASHDQLGAMLASLLKDYGVSGTTSTSLEVAA